MLISARNVRLGMKADLEGDPYADPRSDNTLFEHELVEVTLVEQETPGCTVIHFEGWDACGFPPDHKLTIRRFDASEYRDFIAEFGTDAP